MEDYRFHPDELAPASRRAGISAVMRLRNSADFLEPVVTTHAPYFDEIVAVHNQCTDDTPEILESLRARFPDKLRVFHYEPRVHPSGTPEHLSEPPDSPHSLVNYSNYALARSSCRIVALLDDDHLGIERHVRAVTEAVRDRGRLDHEMWCVSGLNLDRGEDGSLGIHAAAPFAGNGDHGYFEVTTRTYFEHDRRFERLRYQEFRRRFRGMTYWHLKYLKKGHGFANYELDRNPESRYRRHRERFLQARRTLSIESFLRRPRPGENIASLLGRLPLPERLRLRLARYSRIRAAIGPADVAALRKLLPPGRPNSHPARIATEADSESSSTTSSPTHS